MSTNLISIPTLVQSPFIIAKIGDVTFGTYTQGQHNNKVTYPNFMKSISMAKVNGTINTYTLQFEYQVRTGEDPNLLDKIFSKAVKDRRIVLQYGDWNSPSYIYKEEQAIITDVRTQLNMSTSSIVYTVNCTSDAIGLTSTTFNFPSRDAKPSDILMELLNNARYGLKSVFTGMQSNHNVLVNNLIASNDQKVKLLAQTGMTTLGYINYLVASMTPQNNDNAPTSGKSQYMLSMHDDYTNEVGGTYFKVTELSTNTTSKNDADTYVLDVNFPSENFITNLSINNDQSWAILYQYDEAVNQEQYTYSIDDSGRLVTSYAPSIGRSQFTNKTSVTNKQWWTKMTSFPIEAVVTIKGLARPSILMTHVRLNVWFSGGQKHISSGLYVITKQFDEIDSSGYRTTLTLTRVGGDE